ncbi:MAG: energy-coupling factor transporter ATPase [Clostridiales bacterium]|nr:energy-coupling factor transporter ATPase [Clostridiales bacterium]
MEAVKFEKVYFSYEEVEQDDTLFVSDAVFALDGVDLSVEEGEFVAILGHNGSGKSTLARLTNGLLSPTSGKVTVRGLDVSDEKNLFEIRKQVGIIFQNPDNQMVASIVEDDVAFGPENVGVEREEIGNRISFALDSVGMESYRHSTSSRLSGGQKQRIAIAGVLSLKPKIMILDESTAMLDPRGRKEVMDVVLRLNKEEKITVILITHFPEEAMLADRAVVMHRGNIVMQGKPADVLNRAEELEKYALALPRPLKICRALTTGGVVVRDSMDEENVANDIETALKSFTTDLSKNVETTGAGTSLPTETTQTADGIGRVECKNLTHVYNPNSTFETYALSGVDLEINAGEFFGIIGHTGSGKSTFVQHLNALIKVPSAEKKYKAKKQKKGQIEAQKTILTVDGFDLTDKNTDFKALRKKVGMVFQYPEYQLFAETVFEDVAFGLKNFAPDMPKEEVRKAVREAIETVGLNYVEIRKRSPFELSGGQKRRVAIAGVIVTKPEILVLDEPAAGLDPLGKEEIMKLLHKIHKEWCKTIIIVSHDMDEISENCTRAAIFSEGKILAVDMPKELFKNVQRLENVGLDVPFTAKVTEKLRQRGLVVDSDFTADDFVKKILDFIKMEGAGTRLTANQSNPVLVKKGGDYHA